MPVSVPIYVWQGAGGGRRDIHSTGSGVWAIFANSITSHNPSITDGMGVGWLWERRPHARPKSRASGVAREGICFWEWSVGLVVRCGERTHLQSSHTAPQYSSSTVCLYDGRCVCVCVCGLCLHCTTVPYRLGAAARTCCWCCRCRWCCGAFVRACVRALPCMHT